MSTGDKYSLTDVPRDIANGEVDKFGIEKYENGLIQFIEHANTPVTIALQGEWGSGKTSLMNTLKKRLCDDNNATFFGVWINTWEYALMKDAATALLDIVSGLAKKVAEAAEKPYNNIGEKILNACLIGASTYFTKTKDVAEIFTKKPSISDIRTDLEEQISDCVESKKKQGFIFFIDDLDRIDPPVAVQLLELLKNMFTFKHCVFVLAIDYDVVIKGLEPKYGKKTGQNEREFRSFFDKIIQVPFSMPVTNYQIDEFLKESLLSIHYLDENQSNNKNLIVSLSEISGLSVGTNPRALKRLLNSLLLIQCINNPKDKALVDSELDLLVNFSLVSIQIAFPLIYRVLSVNPGFDKWNGETLAQHNIQLEENEFANGYSWEKILLYLCENDDYLKKQAPNILKILNLLKKRIEEKDQKVENVINSIISLSSVITIGEKENPSPKKPTYLDCLQQLYNELELDKPYKYKDIKQGLEKILIKNGITPKETTIGANIRHSIVNFVSRRHYIVKSPNDRAFFYYPDETKKDIIQKFSWGINDNPTIYWGDGKRGYETKLSDLLKNKQLDID